MKLLKIIPLRTDQNSRFKGPKVPGYLKYYILKEQLDFHLIAQILNPGSVERTIRQGRDRLLFTDTRYNKLQRGR
jgi:hypothetical protein